MPAQSPQSIKRFQELHKVGVDDADRLYKVAQWVYDFLIILNWITGVVGTILSIVIFVAARNSLIMVVGGIVVIACTALICFVNYVVAVLSTHVAKVLSNISLSLLEIPPTSHEPEIIASTQTVAPVTNPVNPQPQASQPSLDKPNLAPQRQIPPIAKSCSKCAFLGRREDSAYCGKHSKIIPAPTQETCSMFT